MNLAVYLSAVTINSLVKNFYYLLFKKITWFFGNFFFFFFQIKTFLASYLFILHTKQY